MLQSWPARLSAIGFIWVIVFGNIWAAMAMMGSPIPSWMGVGVAGGIGVTLAGGAAMMGLSVWQRLNPTPSEGEDDAADL